MYMNLRYETDVNKNYNLIARKDDHVNVAIHGVYV